MSLVKSGFKSGGGSGGGGTGDVVGPAAVTDEAIARWDGTGGNTLQDSVVTITDAGAIAGVTTINSTTIPSSKTLVVTTDKISVLAATTSAELAGVISDETGSGALVFGTSPLFTTDITVPNTGLHVLDTNASHDLIIKPGSDLAADRTLTVTTGDADRTLTISGDATISGTNTGDGIGGSTGATDNAILRADGTGGATAQSSALFVSDTAVAPHPILSWGAQTSSVPGIRVSTSVATRLVVSLGDGTSGGSMTGEFYSLAGASTIPIRDGAAGLNLNATTAAENAITWWTTYSSTKSAGIRWVSDGVLRAVNGGVTGPASWLCGKLVEANTAGSGSPNILTALESGTVLTNEGTTAENYHTLPTAVAGYEFTFIVQDADGIRVTAAAGDTIRVAAGVSAAAGFVRCATQGAVLRLVSINATEWIAVFQTGVFTVDV